MENYLSNNEESDATS